MTFGFMKNTIPTSPTVEAVTNSIILGEAILSTIYAADFHIDWSHPDTQNALADNLQITMQQSGLMSHGGYISVR